MLAILQRITGLDRWALEGVLRLAVFFGFFGGWLAALYFVPRFIQLTSWHWLTVIVVIGNALTLGLVVVQSMCSQDQRDAALGLAQMFIVSGFFAGVFFASWRLLVHRSGFPF